MHVNKDLSTVLSAIIREYDIRGIVGEELTPKVAYCLGRAYADYAKEIKCYIRGEGRVAVGHDCRTASFSLAQALSHGLSDGGLHPLYIGMVTTPIVYYATCALELAGGIAVTGSHNPPEFDGFKICLGSDTLYGDELKKLGELALQYEHVSPKPVPEMLQEDVVESYKSELLSRTDREVIAQAAPKVVIDGGNGVAGPVAKEVLESLGCKVRGLYIEPDGRFPNHHPDPTIEDTLKELKEDVVNTKADFGIAFDGDGDRIGVVDENGNVVRGDKLLYLYAKMVLKQNPGAVIMGEVKCSKTVFEAIKRGGGKPLMWKTGHSLIKAKMKETGALMAGEMSGHMFFADRYFGYDDAVYAACRLAECYAAAKLDDPSVAFSKLLADLPATYATPEIRIACPDEEKEDIV
ncbi:MAG: phosphomannomutase/phosphoglucomutase, partial [Acetomicrobium sp.]|nr:phosphomannomutase/phosphoglucomutase [Acetomicrobium sp.]